LEAQVKAGGKSGLLSSEKMPQWAGWALKTLSGKFYKSTATPATIDSGPPLPNTDNQSATAALPKHVVPDKKIVDVDGWGELDEDDEEENVSSSTAFDAKVAAKSENAWNNDLEESDWASWDKKKPSSASTAKPQVKPSSHNALRSGASGGSLKLNTIVQKSIDEDDLDSLLGVSVKPSFPNSGSTLSSTKEANTSGWDNDDFAEFVATAKQNLGPTSAPPVKDSRKAEVAARNEQRRKEMAAKRAAKGIGAMKITPKGD
jgi:hypothetical protein